MDELLVNPVVVRIAGVALLRRVEDNALTVWKIKVVFSSCDFLLIMCLIRDLGAEFRYLHEVR
jgi:hypothetical protein